MSLLSLYYNASALASLAGSRNFSKFVATKDIDTIEVSYGEETRQKGEEYRGDAMGVGQ